MRRIDEISAGFKYLFARKVEARVQFQAVSAPPNDWGPWRSLCGSPGLPRPLSGNPTAFWRRPSGRPGRPALASSGGVAAPNLLVNDQHRTCTDPPWRFYLEVGLVAFVSARIRLTSLREYGGASARRTVEIWWGVSFRTFW